MSRDRIMKASDVFNESNFVFSRKVSFEEAFPTIKEVIVNVEESNIYGQTKNRVCKSSNGMGEYIDCSNSSCYNGGFSIGHILREMISKKETDSETELHCQGYEGSAKGRRRYRSCDHWFKAKVHVDYKETELK